MSDNSSLRSHTRGCAKEGNSDPRAVRRLHGKCIDRVHLAAMILVPKY
jgi:hypothetical protein